MDCLLGQVFKFTIRLQLFAGDIFDPREQRSNSLLHGTFYHPSNIGTKLAYASLEI
jgi:hypothetical protein